MKRLYIVVEGQSEQEFIKSTLSPYLAGKGIFSVTPILIKTSKHGRGGHVNATHLTNTINGLLKETQDTQIIVTTFIDLFRIPTNMPGYDNAQLLSNSIVQVEYLEGCLAEAIGDRRFYPYIQRHEFEALVFSSNIGFEKYFTEDQASRTEVIVNSFNNPEDINSSPESSPSKRILAIVPDYDKVLFGNLLALEIGIDVILSRCPRFATWVSELIRRCF